MQQITLGNSDLEVSRLAYGCMRIAGNGGEDDWERGKQAVRAAFGAGYTVFDHADIYAGGLSEKLFGEVLREWAGMREQVTIIGKCGIRMAGVPVDSSPQRYDSSRDHILKSVDASLSRLGIDTFDLLLLHRPDYLMHAGELATTLRTLKEAGKVEHFGVSNFSPSQFELLQSVLDEPLLVNQVEINLHNISALTDGTLDQCQRLQVTPQAWCPIASVAYPAWGNTFTDEDERRIRAELERQCDIYKVEDWVLVLAWLLRHPAGISPIIGSTTPARIELAVSALSVEYELEDWYRLLEARNGAPVP